MPTQPADADGLTFTSQDLNRAETVRAMERQTTITRGPAVFTQPHPAATAPPAENPDGVPWVVRGARAESPQGWSTRHTELMVRTAETTLRRLRDDAVQVSWKAAWLAVTSADDRLLRRRQL